MSKKLSHSDIQDKIDNVHGKDEYTLQEGSYKTYSNKIIAFHKCGYKWNVLPNGIIDLKVTCPKCSGRIRTMWNYDKFSKKITEISDGEYALDSEFTSVKKPVDIKHLKCGRVRTVLGASALKGSYKCEMCKVKQGTAKMSAGEKKIRDYLEENSISYNFQHVEDDCKYKKVLPFDFGILDEDGTPWAMIEFDGEQHFNRDGFYGFSDSYAAEYDLDLQQLRDSIKDNYCESRGIIMLRIPYNYEGKIDSILNRFFRVHKKV